MLKIMCIIFGTFSANDIVAAVGKETSDFFKSLIHPLKHLIQNRLYPKLYHTPSLFPTLLY